MTDENRSAIKVHKVADNARIDFYPIYFGVNLFLSAEALLYQKMTQLCPRYDGGYWEYYELSNDGIYMAPTGYDAGMRIQVEGNGFDMQLSSDAAGVVATLFMLGQLLTFPGCGEVLQESVTNLYYKLREFALEHVEGDLILAAID